MQSHYVGARELAKNYDDKFSILYAIDHLEAIKDKRVITKGQLTTVEWKEYKERTRQLEDIIKQVKNLLN